MKAFNILFTLFGFIALYSCTSEPHLNETGKIDSLYNRIEEISITHPKEALALLDTVKREQLLKPFYVAHLYCLVYHNGFSQYRLALAYAREAYNDPDARKDTDKFLSLLSLMTDECHTNGDYAESVHYCAEGLALAKKTGNDVYRSDFHITWGLNLLEMEQYDEAFRHIDYAIDILKDEVDKRPCYESLDGLVYAIGMKISLLWDKDRYEEALALRPLFEKTLNELEQRPDTPDGVVDMRRAMGAAVYSCIAYSTHNKAEGDSLYRLLDKTAYASTSEGEYIRIPCLLLAKRYDDALRYLYREKRNLQAYTDTLNWDYIDSHLKMELEAYEGKGDWRSASRVQASILALTDSLRQKERKADALEYAEIYKTDEQARQIDRQKASIRLRDIVLIFTALILSVAIIVIIRILHYNKVINQKNDAMAETIDELMAYKDELLIRQEENIHLREELQALRALSEQSADEPEDAIVEEADEEGEALTNVALNEKDRELYDRASYIIASQRLYLRPDFTKKDLLKEVYIPVNKFSALFREFAGCSFTQYMQNCRLDHAVRLMKEHPQWSLDAIASESQMSRSVFYRLFQKKYGMKPSEFRSKMLS